MGLELLQRLGMRLKVGGKVGEGLEGVRAEMMLDALDVARLRLGVQPEQGEKTGEHLVPVANALGHSPAGFGEGQRAVFFVMQEAFIGELLHHAGDTGLAHA